MNLEVNESDWKFLRLFFVWGSKLGFFFTQVAATGSFQNLQLYKIHIGAL